MAALRGSAKKLKLPFLPFLAPRKKQIDMCVLWSERSTLQEFPKRVCENVMLALTKSSNKTSQTTILQELH